MLFFTEILFSFKLTGSFECSHKKWKILLTANISFPFMILLTNSSCLISVRVGMPLWCFIPMACFVKPLSDDTCQLPSRRVHFTTTLRREQLLWYTGDILHRNSQVSNHNKESSGQIQSYILLTHAHIHPSNLCNNVEGSLKIYLPFVCPSVLFLDAGVEPLGAVSGGFWW